MRSQDKEHGSKQELLINYNLFSINCDINFILFVTSLHGTNTLKINIIIFLCSPMLVRNRIQFIYKQFLVRMDHFITLIFSQVLMQLNRSVLVYEESRITKIERAIVLYRRSLNFLGQ